MRSNNTPFAPVLTAAVLGAGMLVASAENDPVDQKASPLAEQVAETPALELPEIPDMPEALDRPDPKDLSNEIHRGLAYLLETQHESGGWGQGGGWRNQASGRVEGADVEDPPDVGNSAVALLSLYRTGDGFDGEQYGAAMTAGAEYLLSAIDLSDPESLYVTELRDTQLQSKIGAYVDTFLSALVLSEIKDALPTPEMVDQAQVVLDQVIAKIEANQTEDGTFNGNAGWASTLSQGICSKALNRAWSNGAEVSDEALRRDQFNNGKGVVAGASTIATDASEPGSAGVDIYRYSSKLGGLQEFSNNAPAQKAEAQAVLDDENAPAADKEAAAQTIQLANDNLQQADAAFGAVKSQMADAQFVAGFGNNGGEEFLSYMNLSEAMWAKGGEDWIDWDEKVTAMVAGVQNEDGGWSGHHCITGRNFCTATALLTLMADRAPVPES